MEDERVTDEELIRNFQGGSQEAFDEIVDRFRNPLYNFIFRIIGDSAFAEDILQETFVRLWLNKDSYREIARFSTWIYTIAANLSKTELRRRKVRRWLSFSGGKDDRPLDFPDEDANPQRDYERQNIRDRLSEELMKMPLAFREVVVLRDIQELTYEEISTILNIPLGTVKSRVNRGRLRLQKCLADLR